MFDINQFLNFRKMMRDKNPKSVLDALLSFGKVTQSQVQDAKKQAEAFLQLFKGRST